MQAMGLKAKRNWTEGGQTEPDGAQTQNFYPYDGRFPAIATVKEIRPWSYVIFKFLKCKIAQFCKCAVMVLDLMKLVL